MTAKSEKQNHVSAFRKSEEGGAAAPHLPVSLRKLRETPPSRPENRGGGTPISRPGRLSHCYNSSAHRPRSLFELQDVGSVATNAVKPHLNHPSILLSDGFRSLPERGFSTDNQVPKDRDLTTVLQPAKRRLFAIPELGNGGGTVSEVPFYESEEKSLSNRDIWLKVRVTNKEREIIKRKAAKFGMTVSDYVRTALIHSDNLNVTMIDVGPIEEIATELHKQGVNLNQLMKFLNTYGVDVYNAEETYRVLTREGDMFLKVSDVLGQLCEEATRHKVYITVHDFSDGDSDES